jgi:hypothetical protein
MELSLSKTFPRRVRGTVDPSTAHRDRSASHRLTRWIQVIFVLALLHANKNSGRGFAPSHSTHVVPRLRRRKHGAPVQGDRKVQDPWLQPRDGHRRLLDNSDSRSGSTNEECGAAPPALDRPPMDPALPGWANVWCRPSGPGLQTPLSPVHSSLNLPQASRLLLMTKGRVGVSSGNWFEGSQVSEARPGAPFDFTL